MTNILGMKKNLVLMKMLKNPKVRELPADFLMYLKKATADEKFVQIGDKYVINSQFPPFPSKAFDNFMSIADKAFAGKAAPVSCHVVVTNRCNYDCWHCSNYHRKGAPNLPLDLLIGTVKKMQSMGNAVIGITGGEPLLREDLEDFIRAISDVSYTMLFTTGDGFTEERARRLKEAGLFTVVVSLDHFKPEVHDAVRGHKGAFQKALDAVRIAKENGFYTVVSTVPKNEMIDSGEIWEFMEFVKGLEVHEIRFLAPIPTGRIVGKRELRWSQDQREVMWQVHRKFNADKEYPRISVFSLMESEGILGCTAGFYHLFIEGDGTLTPCDMIPLGFGNIKDGGFEAAFEKMTSAYQRPRNSCFLRAAVALIGKGFEEQGFLPLCPEKSTEIVQRVPNKKSSEFFERLREIGKEA